MSQVVKLERQFPFTPSDGFILALDDLCNRTWGGGLLANTEIEIEGQPDRKKLAWLAREMPLRFPLLRAVMRRGALDRSGTGGRTVTGVVPDDAIERARRMDMVAPPLPVPPMPSPVE